MSSRGIVGAKNSRSVSRVDLPSVYCTYLTAMATADIPPASLDRLTGIDPPTQSDDGPYWFGWGHFERSGRHHQVSVRIRPQETGTHEIELTIVPITRSLERDLSEVGAMLDAVAPFPLERHPWCTAHFRYPEDAGTATLAFPVAWKSTGQTAQLRGLRLAFLDENGDDSHWVVMESPTNREYFHTIGFFQPGGLDLALLAPALKRGVGISREFFKVNRRRPRTPATYGEVDE